MVKVAFIVLAVLSALGAYWALASVGAAPSYRCGSAMGPEGVVEVCYWDKEERVF
jgi:hypothetical protein